MDFLKTLSSRTKQSFHMCLKVIGTIYALSENQSNQCESMSTPEDYLSQLSLHSNYEL